MSQAKASVVFNNFVKGLITDSSDFNSDPTSMKDVSNFLLSRKGTLEKRLGLQSEGTLQNFFGDNPQIQQMITYDGKKYMVLSDGVSLGVVDELTNTTKAFFNFNKISSHSFDESLSFSVSDRFIVVTYDLANTFVIEYQEGVFVNLGRIDVKLRDFDGAEDGLDNTTRPTVLTQLHKYNLENQGWGNSFPYQEAYLSTESDFDGGTTTSIEYRTVSGMDYVSFKNTVGSYPSNADIAYLGIYEDPNDGGKKKFKPENIVNTYIGNAQSPMGKKVLSVADRFPRKLDDGTLLQSGLEYPYSRGKASSTFFAGRVFYGSGNMVMFSQTLGRDSKKLGLCYQENDPTSEHASDVLDTDGGAIVISGASGIFKILEVNRNLLVFARNGIWAVSGGEYTFKATNYSVFKVSDYTALNCDVIFNLPNATAFISKSGIMLTTSDKVDQAPVVNNISMNIIQELFSSYDETVLAKTKIAFEDKTGKLGFLFGNDLLVLDTGLQAWVKLELPVGAVGLYTKDSEQYLTSSSQITHLGADVLFNTEEVVISKDELISIVPQLLVMYKLGGTYHICSFSDTSYVDFKDTAYESNYEANFITQPLLFDTPVSKKRLNQIACFFTKTETGYTENEEGGLEYSNPSSCKMQVGWDMPTTSSYTLDPRNAWSREYEVYRLTRYEAKSLGEIPAQALQSLMTRTSVRGVGRTMSLRFSSPSGYDCRLLGWSMEVSVNTRSK